MRRTDLLFLAMMAFAAALASAPPPPPRALIDWAEHWGSRGNEALALTGLASGADTIQP